MLALAASSVIAVAYFAISGIIVGSLIRSHQLFRNRLGAATGAIFFTCALGHASHALHVGELAAAGNGVADSALTDLHTVIIDVATAAVAVFYWSLRRTYGSLMTGAKLFVDMRERQRQALELNDNVAQHLTVAQLALSMNDTDRARVAIDSGLASVKQVIGGLLGDEEDEIPRPGDFVRTEAVGRTAH